CSGLDMNGELRLDKNHFRICRDLSELIRGALAFQARTVEQEEVKRFHVSELPDNLIPNLKWLIPLALDQQTDFSQPISIQEIAAERLEA
ncbi:hypothetical protein MIB92_13120, partial [Aestuariirhabdus sp. Z084]|uniref:hypothetical protein n=1 Tax=Aestuariirhabdus haliotis TaxID=2918751 RepID=UPI00201B4358